MKATTNQRISKEDVVDDMNDELKTPVVVPETNSIEANVAQCPTINYLLQRLEMGEPLDLSTQLAIFEGDSALCVSGTKVFEPSMPNTDEA
jgi:hypothetical protein